MSMTELKRKPLMKPKPSGKFYMHDFQREDISYLSERNSSANWSEMGAMKTTTAEWLWEDKLRPIANPRVLVISTRNGKGPYLESLHEVLPEWDIFNVDTKGTFLVLGEKVIRKKVKLPDPLYFRPVVVMAHYHCFTNRACVPEPKKDSEGNMLLNEDGTAILTQPKCEILLNSHWDFIVVDEAHRIKDPDAQWTRNIKKLRAKFKHIMTGTGFVNNPSEIWSLLNFLFPTVYSNRDKFRKYFCDIEIGEDGYQRIVGIKPGREEEFRALVRQIGVRRTMLEIFPDIAEPIDTVTKVELNPTQRKMYDDMREMLRMLDQKGEPLHSPNVLSMLNRLRQICVATPEVIGEHYDPLLERRVVEVKLREPSSKLDAVMDIIDGLEWDSERKDQVVIYSNFNDPLELLENRLKRKKIPYLRLLTKMSDTKRYELWHDTWPKQEHQVFLTTLKLGGESINLTCAHRAIFLDQDWSPVPNKQARGRVYRPGQKGTAQFVYIRADDTVDYRVLEKNEQKHGWFERIFGEEVEDENGSESEVHN